MTALAESGFLLSPLVDDSVWFRWLATTPWHGPAWQRLLSAKGLQSIRFLPPDRTWLYEQQIAVRLFRMSFPACGPASMAFRSDLLGLSELAESDPRDEVAGGPKTRWENLSGGAALTTPVGASLYLPVSGQNYFLPLSGPACRLKINFGLLCTGPKESPSRHPTRFRINAIDAKGWRKTIWSASLNIARRHTDAEIRTAEVSISLKDVQSLCFETERPDDGGCFVPAWFGVSSN